MRQGRLIVECEGYLPFPQPLCVWPVKAPLPAGWEEVHAVRSILTDLCICGHARGHHVGHSHQCMVLEDLSCACPEFQSEKEIQNGEQA